MDICDQNDWTEEIEGSPMNESAWVVQERVLKSAAIHKRRYALEVLHARIIRARTR